jgi:1-deoxy-D-xylulose-5-phosphate synthase
MPSGSSLKFMMDAFPKRAFDVAEQHTCCNWPLVATQEWFIAFTLLFYKELMTKLFMMWLYKIFQFFVCGAGLVGEDRLRTTVFSI